MIYQYSKLKQYDVLLLTFNEMKQQNIKYNNFSIIYALDACIHFKSFMMELKFIKILLTTINIKIKILKIN